MFVTKLELELNLIHPSKTSKTTTTTTKSSKCRDARVIDIALTARRDSG
jgi:hypothetical protein